MLIDTFNKIVPVRVPMSTLTPSLRVWDIKSDNPLPRLSLKYL